MMQSSSTVFGGMLIFAVFIGPATANARESIDLSAYTCSQFLDDVKNPDGATKLLRSTMMISWATGYAAAHQRKELRVDIGALQLIGNVLGNACSISPTKKAARAAADAIDQYVKK